MTQTVKFDDKTWARLATMAEEQDTTIAALIENTTRRLLIGTVATPRPATRAEELAESRRAHLAAITRRILHLRENGNTVTTIATLTGYSTSYVSKILCDNGARTYERTTQTKEQAA